MRTDTRRSTDTRRYPIVVTVKISRELDAALRRRAREDDRPITSVIRRTLAAGLQEHADDEQLVAAGR